jgi:hypothetical protein
LICACGGIWLATTKGLPLEPCNMPGWLVIFIVILCVLVFMMLINPTGPCHWCPYFCHNRRASNADAGAEPVNPSNVKVLDA